MATYQDGFRIATNIGAMNAYNALTTINHQLQVAQLQLATGKRINSAGDDPAGYTIGTKLQARSAGLSQALTNVGDAQSVLSTAEGGLQAINNILISVKTLVTQAGNAGLASSELQALVTQVNDYMAEVGQIISQTKFNGQALIDTTFTGKNFQVGADSGDTLSVGISTAVDSASLSLNAITTTNIASALSSVDSAINTVSGVLQYVGSLDSRLSFKAQVLNTSITNVDAAQSRIMDADIAAQQVQATKLQILQQTATVQLAQANSTPGGILRLFQ
ncbi:MAG: flagellin [Bacteroidetes bacterium]|nr:flagellin [Bacteroidota bacterium]MCL5738514.1 flagellin [Bacteroidota bacterium]